MSTITLRCPHCKNECLEGDVSHVDYLAISNCCDEVVERVFWCDTCGEREQHDGCDDCMECLLDAAIADPRVIEQCTVELQQQIAVGLAERLRPFLRVRQAA